MVSSDCSAPRKTPTVTLNRERRLSPAVVIRASNPNPDSMELHEMATASQKQAGRTANGQFRPGVSGNRYGNVHRSRHALNADTIREMHAAFRQGGREAIDKVMRTQPAAFLKLLVLLVPREMKVEHSGGVKAMTDEQLEAGIEAIQAMLISAPWRARR